MLDAALAAGRQGQPVADLIGGSPDGAPGREHRCRPSPTTRPPSRPPSPRSPGPSTASRSTPRSRVDEGRRPTLTTESVDGRAVDQQALLASLDQQLSQLDAPGEIRGDIPLTTRAPDHRDRRRRRPRSPRPIASPPDLVLTRGTDSGRSGREAPRKLITLLAGRRRQHHAGASTQAGIDPLVKPIAKRRSTRAPRNAASQARLAARDRRGRAGSKRRPDAGRRGDRRGDRREPLAARQAGHRGRAARSPSSRSRSPPLSTAEAKAIAPEDDEHLASWTTYFPIYDRQRLRRQHLDPGQADQRLRRWPRRDVRLLEGRRARSPARRATATAARSSTARPSRRARSPAASARAPRRCSMRRSAPARRWAPGGTTTTTSTATRSAWTPRSSSRAAGSKQTMSFDQRHEVPGADPRHQHPPGSSGYVTFELYSVPGGRTVVDQRPRSSRTGTRRRDTVQYTTSLPKGYVEARRVPGERRDVWRHRDRLRERQGSALEDVLLALRDDHGRRAPRRGAARPSRPPRPGPPPPPPDLRVVPWRSRGPGGSTASSTRSIRARSRIPTATGSATCRASSGGSTTSPGSASTPSGCRRSSARRCATSATTSPTTATSTPSSGRSRTPTG